MKKTITGEPFAFPTPIFIIGTYDQDGTPNAMNAAWAGVSVSAPPCVTVSVRKERKTYENIQELKEFTVNIPNKSVLKEADYFGMISGHKAQKFEAVGLTAVKAEHVNAPYIEEFPVNFECKVVETTEIGSHIIIIGEILNAMADEGCFNENGKVTLHGSGAVAFDPTTRNYHEIGEVAARAFSYGKDLLKK